MLTLSSLTGSKLLLSYSRPPKAQIWTRTLDRFTKLGTTSQVYTPRTLLSWRKLALGEYVSTFIFKLWPLIICRCIIRTRMSSLIFFLQVWFLSLAKRTPACVFVCRLWSRRKWIWTLTFTETGLWRTPRPVWTSSSRRRKPVLSINTAKWDRTTTGLESQSFLDRLEILNQIQSEGSQLEPKQTLMVWLWF